MAALIQDEEYDSTDELEEQSDNKFADSILSNNKKQSTKDGYKQKLSHLFSWMKENHPYLLDEKDEPIIVPIAQDILKPFIGSISRLKVKNGDLSGKKKLASASSVNGYRSAIKYYYSARNTVADADTEKFFKNYNQGIFFESGGGVGFARYLLLASFICAHTILQVTKELLL